MFLHLGNQVCFSKISWWVSSTFFNTRAFHIYDTRDLESGYLFIFMPLPWLDFNESWVQENLSFHFKLLVTDHELGSHSIIGGILRNAGQKVAGDIIIDFGVGSMQLAIR